MKKSILKSLEPKTKPLFRFKNSNTKLNAPGTTKTIDTDPTTTTSTTVTW